MKPKTTTKKPTQFGLAKALGISRQLVAAHAKKPDAPALDDVAGWTAYLAQVGRVGSVPAELRRAIAQERLEILKETKAKLARENAIEAKELMPVADAVRHAQTAGSYFMAELERLEREGPPAWAGGTAISIATHLSGCIERIRKELSAKLNSIGE